MSISQTTLFSSNVVLLGAVGTPSAPQPYFGWGTPVAPSVQSSNQRIYAGTGNPNGTLTAPRGSLYIQNSAAPTIWLNQDGGTVWINSTGVASFIADPGNGGAISVTNSGVCAMTIGAGAETSTLADPVFDGQQIILEAEVVGGGTRAVTAAHAINVANNTVMTFNAVRDSILLTAMPVSGSLLWQVGWNNSVALS